MVSLSHVIYAPGCKVEMFYLNVEAVNTHRDRPLVSRLKLTPNLRFRLNTNLRILNLYCDNSKCFVVLIFYS